MNIDQLLATPSDLPVPEVRRLAAEVYRDIKAWPAAERNKLCETLWKHDGGVLVICLYQRFAKQCGLCEFRLFEKWLERHARHWGHCDGIAHYLLAAAIANQPDLAERVVPWTASPNRWKRRGAAVALVHEARAGRHTGVILEVAERLLADPDDLVRKGVGWLLKEAYRKQPRAVLHLLGAHRARVPRLVLRIATEKMPAGERARILAGAVAGPGDLSTRKGFSRQ